MTTFSFNQTSELTKRLPDFELSYETISHKKVSNDYNITLAIPYGKKAFLWFTYYKAKNVCFLMELGKDKKITNVSMISENIPLDLAYGTILYGCLCEIPESRTFFVIEDIMYYQGINTSKQSFSEKFNFLYNLLSEHEDLFINNDTLYTTLPVFWTIQSEENTIPEKYKPNIPYTIHHLQHRSNKKIVPYLNYQWSKNLVPSVSKYAPDIPNDLLFIPPSLPRFSFAKPQYKMTTTFEVKADLQNDIYHLYAFGKNSERVYCGIAYIPNYNTSKYMNTLFRRIKENVSLDYLEESDDEEDFQDLRIDKYVNLEKRLTIECVYKNKFKRWVPIKQIEGRSSIVHIRQL